MASKTLFCTSTIFSALYVTYMVCIRHMLHAEVQHDLVPDVPLHEVQDVLRVELETKVAKDYAKFCNHGEGLLALSP